MPRRQPQWHQAIAPASDRRSRLSVAGTKAATLLTRSDATSPFDATNRADIGNDEDTNQTRGDQQIYGQA